MNDTDVVYLEQHNNRKQGDVGLGMAISWFTSHGYTVCIPLTDSQRYDLVVEMDSELKKIQVETPNHRPGDKKSGQYGVCIKTSGGNKSGTGKIKLYDCGEKFWCYGCGSLFPEYRAWCEDWPPDEKRWIRPKNVINKFAPVV